MKRGSTPTVFATAAAAVALVPSLLFLWAVTLPIITTTAFAQRQAISGVRIQFTCPQDELQDFTTAMTDPINLLQKKTRGRLARSCAQVAKHQISSFSVHNSNTLNLDMDSTKSGVLVNRCVEKKSLQANSCTLVAVEPIVACNTTYNESVIVTVDVGKRVTSLLFKGEGKLVRPMRVLGRKFSSACGIDQCDVDLWNAGAITVESKTKFTMRVKDGATVNTLSTCVASKAIEVRHWFTINDVFIPTTTTTTTNNPCSML
eukprot:m.29202 g.29202  ORF g.29202 m.29202 type:complete len:260 (+) comp6127_c0_seq3:51-830(+)